MINFTERVPSVGALFSLLSLLAVLFFSPPLLEAKDSRITQDGMFALNAGEVRGTTPFFRMLAGYESRFSSLTGYSVENFPPILVVLHPSSEVTLCVSSLRVDAVEGGLPHIQVDLASGQEQGTLSRNFLATAMLLREYYGSKAPTAGGLIPVYPVWLTRGLGLLCSPKEDKQVMPSHYLQGEAPPTIEDFLTQRAPEVENLSLSDLYDAMAAALLRAGLTERMSKEGGDGNLAVFRNWIGHYDSQTPHLNPPSWPAGWKKRPIEKRWLLIMSAPTGEDSLTSKLLSVTETVAAYDALLAELPTPGHSIALLRKEKGADFLITDFARRILALRLRANPMATPLLDGTLQFLSKMKHLSEKKLAEEEKTLSSLHSKILNQSQSIKEYLDWYEAAKLPIRSGLYERLLSTPETRIKKGPVGHYLDMVEERGW